MPLFKIYAVVDSWSEKILKSHMVFLKEDCYTDQLQFFTITLALILGNLDVIFKTLDTKLTTNDQNAHFSKLQHFPIAWMQYT
jgi:hypothetical protein